MTIDDTAGKRAPGQTLVAARLAAGLTQGLALYLLYQAANHKVWPATDGQVFAPLLVASLAVPLIFILSVGNFRTRSVALWVLGGAALTTFLGWYDIWHGWPTYWSGTLELPQIIPSGVTLFGAAVLLFISHALIAGGDHDRRFRATYPTHFDVSWKLGLQLALAVLFVAIFWGLLWLGASLFGLVKLTFFREMIGKEWFSIPMSALAIALALHVTDVRPNLVRGVRSLVLILFSWLLPLMALIAIGFLFALVFTGLTPLWQTRRATALLLICVSTLIVLINATYQDGVPEKPVSRIFRLTASAAALSLTPLSLLAAYALTLRVQQYGWTVDRITAAAFVLIALGYAGGYTFAVLGKGAWLKRIESWNFAVALLTLATLFAYLSPIADPYRISVSSQLARLENKRISAEKLDLAELRWEGGRFGKAALEQLAKDSDRTLAKRAATMLAKPSRYASVTTPPSPETTLTVFPKGTSLPLSFIKDVKRLDKNFEGPVCLRHQDFACDAFLIDFDQDGRNEILVVSEGGHGTVFAQNKKWELVGRLPTALCPKDVEALKSGAFRLQAPIAKYRVLEIGGNSFTFTSISENRICHR